MFLIDDTILLVIDVQGKLVQTVYGKEKLIDVIDKMIDACQMLELPILITEQVPDKIGETIAPIKKKTEFQKYITKSTFSCCSETEFMNELNELGRKQIIVTGIEAHVCVYQTVGDLIKKGFEVQVVCDGVSSRKKENKDIALERMKHLGAQLTCFEMIVCELLKTSKHEKFKDIMRLIK